PGEQDGATGVFVVDLLEANKLAGGNIELSLDDIVRPAQADDIGLRMTCQTKDNRLPGLTEARGERGVFQARPEVFGLGGSPNAETVGVAATLLAPGIHSPMAGHFQLDRGISIPLVEIQLKAFGFRPRHEIEILTGSKPADANRD